MKETDIDSLKLYHHDNDNSTVVSDTTDGSDDYRFALPVCACVTVIILLWFMIGRCRNNV